MNSLEGKVALITGASRGIGAAVARSLAEQGVNLGLASRSGDDLGLDAVAQPCDVRDPDQLESIVAATVERFGRLDILVANAGVGAYGPFLDLSREFADEMIDVNLKGTIWAVRAALPHLLESDAADVVLLASEAGRRGLPNEAVYCASKFGQVGLGRALDHELRERGVRCTQCLSRRRRHRLRPRRRARPDAGRAARDDDRRGRRRSGAVRADAAARPPHPRDGAASGDRALLGLSAR